MGDGPANGRRRRFGRLHPAGVMAFVIAVVAMALITVFVWVATRSPALVTFLAAATIAVGSIATAAVTHVNVRGDDDNPGSRS